MTIHGMWPEQAIYLTWTVWLATWVIAALWANRTLKVPELSREIPYRVLAMAGFVLLLFVWSENSVAFSRGLRAVNPLAQRYWALSPDWGWAMVGLAALGFLFAWWARIHLGRLWSGRITRKESHRIVDTGPYAIVRHPIYTGILLAALATAAEKANLAAILGAGFMVAGYWMKAKLEERFLREELGPEDYDAYRRRVPLLVPFGPK